LALKQAVSEVDGKTYWGLVNTKGDNEALIASAYTLPQLAYFKKVVSHFFPITFENHIRT